MEGYATSVRSLEGYDYIQFLKQRPHSVSVRGRRVGESLFAGRNMLANSRENPAKIALETARKFAIIGGGFLFRKPLS